MAVSLVGVLDNGKSIVDMGLFGTTGVVRGLLSQRGHLDRCIPVLFAELTITEIQESDCYQGYEQEHPKDHSGNHPRLAGMVSHLVNDGMY